MSLYLYLTDHHDKIVSIQFAKLDTFHMPYKDNGITRLATLNKVFAFFANFAKASFLNLCDNLFPMKK